MSALGYPERLGRLRAMAEGYLRMGSRSSRAELAVVLNEEMERTLAGDPPVMSPLATDRPGEAELLGALKRIAFEPFGPADATPEQVLAAVTEFARAVVALCGDRS